MYAIVNIIFGYPLTDKKLQETKEIDLILDPEDDKEIDGILQYYSGSGNTIPLAFGIELGEFNEACDYVEIGNGKIPFGPKLDQVKKFHKKWDALDDSIKKVIIKKFPQGPFTFYLWSTS